ncbi:DUF3843 family protein [Algivirga pacifica]|uniref:DUF3843 family protein n=1 Tax=Algivirga pacifica TaxID=1162670 RepID=A0ABP9DFS9_9BACT
MRPKIKAAKIYIKQWVILKPYQNHAPTDNYYLALSNQIRAAIRETEMDREILRFMEEETLGELCCFIASYLEDLVSETNIWNTFVQLHYKAYGKYLPFYDTAKYDVGEINLQDIQFLIWYFMQAINEEVVFVPTNLYMTAVAHKIMGVLEEAWEYAPENELLKNTYAIEPDEKDFYKARHLMDILLLKTYLFYPDTAAKFQLELLDLVQENQDDTNVIGKMNELRTGFVHKTRTRLMGLNGQEWAAALMGDESPLSKAFQEMSPRVFGFFYYKGQDETSVFLEHIATERKVNLTKKSFDHYGDLSKKDTVIMIGMAAWRGEWWFSGVWVNDVGSPSLIQDEKQSLKSKALFNFMEDHSVDEGILKKQEKQFLKINGNSLIAFLKEGQLSEFVQAFMKASAEAEGVEPRRIQVPTKDPESPVIVFFNPKKGLEMVSGCLSAFPDKDNPFFDLEECTDDTIELLFTPDFSVELAYYCVENYRHLIPFLNGEEGDLYVNHFDFLMRFWKGNDYFAAPYITYQT